MKKIFLAAIIFCSACGTPAVLLRKDVKINRLGIRFVSEPTANSFLVDKFDENVDAFIMEYNSRPNRTMELYRASANDSSTLEIKLVGTQLVSDGQQVAGVLVSLAGFSLPIIMASGGAPIILWFYYFPRVKSVTELSLSEDIGDPIRSRNEFVLTSPGFLKSTEKQIDKHIVSFDKLLDTLVIQIENQNRKK